jgi:hypothetical protein
VTLGRELCNRVATPFTIHQLNVGNNHSTRWVRSEPFFNHGLVCFRINAPQMIRRRFTMSSGLCKRSRHIRGIRAEADSAPTVDRQHSLHLFSLLPRSNLHQPAKPRASHRQISCTSNETRWPSSPNVHSISGSVSHAEQSAPTRANARLCWQVRWCDQYSLPLLGCDGMCSGAVLLRASGNHPASSRWMVCVAIERGFRHFVPIHGWAI